MKTWAASGRPSWVGEIRGPGSGGRSEYMDGLRGGGPPGGRSGEEEQEE